jgi:hypothetical protein
MLSPLLFSLVADGMAGILKAIARKGVATGLGPKLVEGCLTNFHYADGSVLFMENSAQNIANVKFLFCLHEE